MADTFGVCAQYWRAEELAVYKPDLWTLMKYVGASYIEGTISRSYADQAAQYGIKIAMSYTSPFPNPDNPQEFSSNAAIKAYLDSCNIAQFRNHPGVFGHMLTGEPCMGYTFDSENPSAALLNLISVFKYACDYVRTLDPTHPVYIALDPAGAYYEDASGTYLAKRKAWINLFIDFCDILDYHYYVTGGSGTEFWRDPIGTQTRLVKMLDQVLIPCSKGKRIIIGETGAPSPAYLDYNGNLAYYTEQQQADYYRIFGIETKKRGILVNAFKLVDYNAWEYQYDAYGLFRPDNDGTMNIPKMAASLVKDYLSIGTIPVTPTLSVKSKINGTEISGMPFTITLTGTLTIETTPVVGAISVNGTSVGDGHYSAVLPVGSCTVSFGAVSGYTTPSSITVTVFQNIVTSVVGTYVSTTPTNLLLNPSVESGTATPNNWTGAKTANMTATLTWVSDPHTGTKAVRIDATYNSAQSINESAYWRQIITVVAGKTYKIRCWYKSNVTARLLLLANNPPAYTNVQLSLPASSSWTQSAWISITVPLDATQLLADARLFNQATGYAVFDDFELQVV